jgi:hypothetical protein
MSRLNLPPLPATFMLVLTAISMFSLGRAPGPPRLRTRDLEVQITLNLQSVNADA